MLSIYLISNRYWTLNLFLDIHAQQIEKNINNDSSTKNNEIKNSGMLLLDKYLLQL